MAKDYKIEEIDELVRKILSKNNEDMHAGVIGIRKLSCTFFGEVDKNIAEDQKLQQVLLQMASDQTKPHLQMESLWVLCNFLAGDSHNF